MHKFPANFHDALLHIPAPAEIKVIAACYSSLETGSSKCRNEKLPISGFREEGL